MKSVTEPIIYKGEFFLKDVPDNRHKGILTINGDGAATLEIFGSFNTASPAVNYDTYTIWGQGFDGVALSLLECSRKQKKTTFGISDVETWAVHFVLVGALVPDRVTPFFETVSAEIEGLRKWVGIDGGILSFKEDGTSLDYHYEDPLSINFTLSDMFAGSIYFKNQFWVMQDFKNNTEQHTRLQLESLEKLSLNEFIVRVRNFRKLISYFIGQKVRISRMIFTSPEVLVKVINPTRGYQPGPQVMELFFNDNETYSDLSDHPIYYVKFKDIQPEFELIIRKWFDLMNSPLAPVTTILLEAITDHYFFEENDFLRAWQGVEAFHRIILQDTAALKEKFALWFLKIEGFVTDKKLFKKLQSRLKHGYEMPAAERLKVLLIDNAETLKFTSNATVFQGWVTEMGDSRNYMTHYDPTYAERKADVQQLVYYTGLLKALLMILVLRHLGVQEEILRNISDHTSFSLRKLRSQTNSRNTN